MLFPAYYYFSPPDGFELGTNVGKKLGFFDGKVLGTTDKIERRKNMAKSEGRALLTTLGTT